jgi:hypothetical protein
MKARDGTVLLTAGAPELSIRNLSSHVTHPQVTLFMREGNILQIPEHCGPGTLPRLLMLYRQIRGPENLFATFETHVLTMPPQQFEHHHPAELVTRRPERHAQNFSFALIRS